MLALLIVGFAAAVGYVHVCGTATRPVNGAATRQPIGVTQLLNASATHQVNSATDQQR